VQKEYYGNGPSVALLADAEAHDRLSLRVQADRERTERAQLQAAETALVALSQLSDLLVRANLQAAGYHQHARGLWRRRRYRHANVDAKAA
jgi:hypothetical protein